MKMFKWIMLLLLASPVACVSGAGGGVERLNPEQFESTINSTSGALIIDVRTPEEFAQGHINGAQLMNIYDQDFEQKVAALPKDKPVFVYCRSSNRSMQAVPAFQKVGFKQIYELAGGMNAWYASGKQVKK
jgi:rhodanese-related sulfurtransferase